VDFVVVDVLNDSAGREQLMRLGVRKVPVVAKGDKFVFGQMLEHIAEFVGLAGTGQQKLPAEELVPRFQVILDAARRLIAQVPDERIHERVIPNRDRTIRLLSHHMFRIAEAFLEAWDGAEYTAQFHSIPPAADIQTIQQIVAYGDSVRAKFDAWWDRAEDKACRKTLATFFGPCPAHDLLERATWHTAQHCRQLADVLTRFGILPDRPLTPAQLAGLPLPERLYE
jgi:hypothetical protein